jgi:hypothetical protein
LRDLIHVNLFRALLDFRTCIQRSLIHDDIMTLKRKINKERNYVRGVRVRYAQELHPLKIISDLFHISTVISSINTVNINRRSFFGPKQFKVSKAYVRLHPFSPS